MILSAACCAWFGWAVLVLDRWASIPGPGPTPRPFPYPDKLLDAWMRAHYAAAEGCGPGPYSSMRGALLAITGVFCVTAVAVIAHLVWQWARARGSLTEGRDSSP